MSDCHYWVSRTEPLTGLDGEPTDPKNPLLGMFVWEVAELLAADGGISETAVLFDSKNHQMMFSGVVAATTERDALDAAATAFARSIEKAGGIDDHGETARWFLELLEKPAGTEFTLLKLAA